MVKKTDHAGQAYKVTLPAAQVIGQRYSQHKQEKSVAASDLAQAKAGKSYTFRGKSTVRTSGTPLKGH